MFGVDLKLILVATLILLCWLMITRAPVYLPRLDANAPPPPDDEAYVFGFATLTNPVVRFVVLGRHAPAEPAALRGWQRHRRDLRDAPDLVLNGVRFRVTPDEMIRLDRYERTGRRYRRDLMELEDGTMAWVYRLIGEAGLEAVMD
jgi:hypothetical protein